MRAMKVFPTLLLFQHGQLSAYSAWQWLLKVRKDILEAQAVATPSVEAFSVGNLAIA